MNKDYLAPLAVFALVFVGAAFLIVSAFVWISRGKSSFWTLKKMKLGAIILTLNSFIISGCMSGCYQTTCYDTVDPNGGEEPQVMCYDVVAVDVVQIEADDLEQKKSNVIKGVIFDPQQEEYSYTFVRNKTKDTLQKGDFKLAANDTIPYERTFSVEINAKLEAGRYWFNVYKFGDYANSIESKQINIE